jgi:hypothetical protein
MRELTVMMIDAVRYDYIKILLRGFILLEATWVPSKGACSLFPILFLS